MAMFLIPRLDAAWVMHVILMMMILLIMRSVIILTLMMSGGMIFLQWQSLLLIHPLEVVVAAVHPMVAVGAVEGS